MQDFRTYRHVPLSAPTTGHGTGHPLDAVIPQAPGISEAWKNSRPLHADRPKQSFAWPGFLPVRNRILDAAYPRTVPFKDQIAGCTWIKHIVNRLTSACGTQDRNVHRAQIEKAMELRHGLFIALECARSYRRSCRQTGRADHSHAANPDPVPWPRSGGQAGGCLDLARSGVSRYSWLYPGQHYRRSGSCYTGRFRCPGSGWLIRCYPGDVTRRGSSFQNLSRFTSRL